MMKKKVMGNKYYFFWGGEFSNWYPSKFTIGSFTFNCGEQWMMIQKAITFQDYEAAVKIMREESPKVQKALGRSVRGYDNAVWESVRYELVKTGLREKFLQNPKLMDYLLSKKGMEIVEASPEDRIWGIGYSEHTAMANIDKWGENLLGKVLMELRDEFLGYGKG